MNDNKTYLGTGWSFPPTFSKTVCDVELISGEEDIRSSLEIILSTSLRERVMRPDFGSNINSLIHEPLDTTTRNLVIKLLTNAIYIHEPRVTPEEINLEEDALNGILTVTVEYTTRATNNRSNIVYPFYLIEGTNI